MSKRILSLFLALCMVVLAVPMFVIGSFADDLPTVPYATSFADNKPTYKNGATYAESNPVFYLKTGEGDKYYTPMTFNGNWDVVIRDVNYYDDARLANLLTNAQEGGDGDSFLTCGLGNYGDYSSMRWKESGYWGKTASFKIVADHTIGYRYTSPYTGTATVSFAEGLLSPRTDGDVFFAVFVNGTMVWPTAKGSYADHADWYKIEAATTDAQTPDVTALENLTITAGDRIEITAAAAAGTWCVYCMPTITFSEITAQGEAGIDPVAAASSLNQNAAVRYHYYVDTEDGTKAIWYDDWKIGAQTSADPADFVVFESYNTQYSFPQYSSDNWGNGFQYNWGDLVTPAKDARKCGFLYTVKADGLMTLDVKKMVAKSANAHYVAIFQNGTMIWPEAGGAYDDKTDWFFLAEAKDYGTVANPDTDMKVTAYVETGDKITVLTWHAGENVAGEASRSVNNTRIVCSYEAFGKLPTFNVAATTENTISAALDAGVMSEVRSVKLGVDSVLGANGNPILTAVTPVEDVYTITAKGGTKLIYEITGLIGGEEKTVTGEAPLKVDLTYAFTAPTVDFDNDGAITYNGGWDFVTYENATQIGKGALAMSAWSIEGTKWPYAVISKTRVTDDVANAVAGVTMWHQPDWGGTGEGLGDDRPSAAPAMSLRARGGNIVGYRYTAPYTGTVNIDPGELVGKMYGRNWATNVGFAIYVDGVRVWPTDAEVADTEKTAVNADGWYTLIHDKNGTTPYTDEDSYLPAAELELAREAMTGIKVAKGAQIEFLMIGYGDNKWSNVGEIYKNPSVTFTEADLPKTLVTTMSTDVDITYPNVTATATNPGDVMNFTTFCVANPEITDEVDQKTAYKAYLLDALKITYNGAWSNGVVKQNGTYVKLGYWFAMGEKSFNSQAWDPSWYVTEDAMAARVNAFVDNGKATTIWEADIGLGAYFTMDWAGVTAFAPSSYTTSSKGATVYADVFTASSTGNATFSYNNVVTQDGCYFAIAIDGVVVWPAGATMADKSTWYGANSETISAAAMNESLAALAPIKVVRGSNVEFCAVRSAKTPAGSFMDPVVTMEVFASMEHAVIFCDGNGNPLEKFTVVDGAAMPVPQNKFLCDGFDINGDGEVDELPETVTEDLRLIPVNDYSTPDVFYDHMPAIVDGASTGRNGNWAAVHGHWTEDISLEDSNATWYYEKETGFMTVADGTILRSSEAGLWDASGGGMYANGKFAIRTTESLAGNGTMWTAPKTGRVTIDFKKLDDVRELNADQGAEATIAAYFAILVNGKIVWPSNGKPWKFDEGVTYTETGTKTANMLLAEHEAFPTLTVCEGDEIAFIANEANPHTWMFYMNPVVTYTDLLSAPTLNEAQPVLGSDFKLRFSVNGDELADELGVIYKETAYAVQDGWATLPAIAAKAMTDDIKVTPYAKFGDSVLKGAETTTSFAAIVKAAETLSDYAKAALNYGAAVQTYLGYNTSKLANDGIDPVAPAAQHTNVYDLTTELGADDELAVFETASILMNDDFALKIVVVNADSAFKLEVADNAGFTGSVKLELKHCALGSKASEYKAIYEGLTVNDLGKTLYLRVVDGDGEVMSETLTYSIITYAMRIAGKGNTDLANAILALYDNNQPA